MVRGVTDGPRISQDNPNIGTQHTEEAKTPDKLTLPQLNGILDNLGLGTLGGAVEPLATKGTAEDTPRQDGPVRDRGESVKNFFKAVGKGISSFFGKIGDAFSKAFEAIKGAVAARAEAQPQVQPNPAVQTTPKPVLDRQGGNLKDFCEELGKTLETNYNAYLQNTQDDPPMGRAEFVKQKLPDPPGGRDGIDPNSIGFVGDRIDDVRANINDVINPGLNEMRQLVLDRLTEMPTVDIAMNTTFGEALEVLNGNAPTFLRGDSAYTKLDKFVSREAIPFGTVAQSVITARNDVITTNGHLGNIDGVPLSWESVTPEQAQGAELLADNILNDLLDTNPDRPESYFNSIPDSYRKHLSDKAEEIMSQTSVPVEDRQDAVKMMYANSLFLRGICGDLTTTSAVTFNGTNSRDYVVKTMQFVQTFLNGAGPEYHKKTNDEGVGAMNRTMQTHQPKLDAFLKALGMPDLGETPDTDDQKSVTE